MNAYFQSPFKIPFKNRKTSIKPQYLRAHSTSSILRQHKQEFFEKKKDKVPTEPGKVSAEPRKDYGEAKKVEDKPDKAGAQPTIREKSPIQKSCF